MKEDNNMQCCVPFCGSTSFSRTGKDNAISFHRLPSEVNRRTAWLKALGLTDQLLKSAVVCSQHFLDDDICNTDNGLKISTDAVPSTVQVCMICLHTDRKVMLMSKLKLEEAYEKLTGHLLAGSRNLRQTLCEQCAEGLLNCNKFREKTLRARTLMMDLVEKYKFITIQHIKMLNHTENQMTSTMHDDCDYKVESKRAKLEETGRTVVEIEIMKSEPCYVSDSYNYEGNVVVKEEYLSDDSTVDERQHDDEICSNTSEKPAAPFAYEVEVLGTLVPLKKELNIFSCTLCDAEFTSDREYNEHMSMHIQDIDDDNDTSRLCEPGTPAASSCSTQLHMVESKRAVHRINQPQPAASLGHTLVAHIEPPPSEQTDASVQSVEIQIDGNVAFPKLFKCELAHSSDLRLGNQSAEGHFTCALCNNSFAHKCSLMRHMRKHTGEKPFSCDSCDAKFAEHGAFKRHMDHHARGKYVSCNSCDAKLSQNNSLVTHERSNTRERPFPCTLCDAKFTQSGALKRHTETHTGEKSLSCDRCDAKFSHNSSLISHQRTHTREKPFSCTLCDAKFTQSGALKRHVDTHSGKKSLRCNICDVKFSQNSSLIRHQITHTGEKPFSCTLCDAKFTQSGALKRHIDAHSGEKSFTCKLCGSKFTQNSSLVRHMKTHTIEKRFNCKLCAVNFAFRSALKKHMRTHGRVCEVCDQEFPNKKNLVAHMRTHAIEESFSCNLCDATFTQNSYLAEHLKTHVTDKQYYCELCNYEFANKRSLMIHSRSHTGEKPFSCNVCDAKFTQNCNLARHMRIHTDEQP